MKTHLNTPANEAVFGENVTTWNLAKSFVLVGGILAVASEFAVLHNAIITHIAGLLPPANWVKTGALLLTLFIVLALARERIRTGKQASKILITKEKGLGKGANVAVVVSCLIVFGASFALSWLGASEGVGAMLPEPKPVNTTEQDNAQNTAINALQAQYTQDSISIARNYKNLVSAKKTEYNGKIKTWKSKQNQDATVSGQNWAKKQIKAIEEERDNSINMLVSEKNTQLTALLNQKTNNINTQTSQHTKSKQIVIEQAEQKAARVSWFAQTATNIIPIIIVSALFLQLIGLFLIEKFKAASGIKEVVLPNRYDLAPGLIEEIGEAGAIVAGSWARTLINGIKKLKTNPTIDESMDSLIEYRLNGYKKTVFDIGEAEKTEKHTKIGFQMPEKQVKDEINQFKSKEIEQKTEENIEPGAHLRRIFNKRGVGETFSAEPETTGKIVTLDFAARQAATYKSLAKNGERNPERTQKLANYWAWVVDEMKSTGRVSMQIPNFNPDNF